MKKILFFLLAITFVSHTFAQWTRTNGPEGVAVSFLTNIDGTLYAGTEVNGVYISTDDGLTWLARNSGIETYRVSSIISFQGYIFAGTFGGGVYRSSDSGLTWTPSTTGNDLFVYSLVTNNPYIFASAGNGGVFRSSDNGATWELKLNAIFGVDAMCKSGNKIFASESNYTSYTTDNGETWMNVQQLEGAVIFSYYCIGDTIFAGGQTKIYRSTDNGNNFTTINLNLGFSIINVYAITSLGSALYTATSYDGVYKSTDFGSNWIPSNEGMGPKDVRAITLTNSSTLIAGTHYVGMYRSTDLGLSWSKSQSGFPAGISILSLLENNSSIYAGTRDGVFRTDDDGDSWMKMGGTNDTTMYSNVWAMCEHNGAIYASMQLYFDATVYKTTDKGINWVRCGMTGFPPGLSFIKGLEGSGNNIVAGTDEGIFYSSNGGDNWNPTNVLNLNIPSLASSGNYVYAAVPSGAGIYRSVDNGVNWSVSLQSTIDYIEVAALNNYAFAGSFFGGARYSNNYGSTWFESGGFPADASIFAIGLVDGSMVLAGTDLSPNWIYVSFNNGNFFSPYSEGLFENAPVEAFAVNETYTFAGTDYNGVWRRYLPGVPVELISYYAEVINNSVKIFWKTASEENNSGFEIQRSNQTNKDKWNVIGFIKGNGTTNEISSYSFTDENLVQGNYNYRLRQIDFNGNFRYSETVNVEVNSLEELLLYQNYPNPFNPATSIQYSIPVEERVKLEIFNHLGERIATLVDRVEEPGQYEISFDGSSLSSGTYIYKLSAGSFIAAKKMILLK